MTAVRAGLTALADRRFRYRRLTLAPGVRLTDSGLRDDVVAGTAGLNSSARTVVGALVAGATVDGAASLLQARFPMSPVRRDVLRLVAGLNDAGLLNVQRRPVDHCWVGSPWLAAAGLRHPTRTAGWLAARSMELTFANRREVVIPGGLLSLVAAVAGCLLPMTVALWTVAVVLAATGSSLAVQVIVASAVLVGSVAAHEVAHAVGLGGGRVSYVRSLGGVRVLVAHRDAHRRWRAAAAGPLAGAAVAAVALALALTVRAGLDVAAALAIAASHLVSLLPWAPDGKVLRSPAPDVVRTDSAPQHPEQRASTS
ncbi:PqqD family protein [Angustibacter sp. McL0619]|uniref:PqqD family protein n=1 Tax=Angustibacter sp. McL0619 TaxID=3415676 RepID=UPI003CF71255